ncbi:MAG: nucleotidyltransferase domain-containing protein [Dehalococcoidia bacterium]
MVATATELDTAITEFIARLQKGIRVEAAILYGSYAHGSPDEWSDIDLAIISPDFEGLSGSRRQEMISGLTLERDPRMAPIGYPSSEFHDPEPQTFISEIIRTGKIVYQAPQS